MARTSPLDPKQEQELMTFLWRPEIAQYPERFAKVCYPWGKEGTPLEGMTGPRSWQLDQLTAYGENIRENIRRKNIGQVLKTHQSAICSGRGIGKTAFYGMLSHFHASCWIGSTTIVAANGEPQLMNKTLPEMRKWFTLGLNAHWFDISAMSIKPEAWFRALLETQLKIDCGYYYIQGQLWTEENPDAFAGAHNNNGLIVLMDEASGIPTPIWTVTKGFFTEPCPTRAHFAISNGRRNTGAFFECFNRMREYWRHKNIDSRTVEGVDTADLDQIIRQFGIDSDEARVEVLGQFPHAGTLQFIPSILAEEAATRPDAEIHLSDPFIIGGDIARYGDDKSWIVFRKGMDARTHAPIPMKGLDLMQQAARFAEAYTNYHADAIFIDEGGIGAGVIDRLRQLGIPVIGVNFGAKSDNLFFGQETAKYGNKGTEIWGSMRNALRNGLNIPNDPYFISDLTGREYKYNVQNALMLEPKDAMKSRGLPSPDYADALACTFAYPVESRFDAGRGGHTHKGNILDHDYNPFARMA